MTAPKQYRHTGTDCQHMGRKGVQSSGQGICQQCVAPLRPKYAGDHKLFEVLGVLLLDSRGRLRKPFPITHITYSL
jgi:hypothetical protein